MPTAERVGRRRRSSVFLAGIPAAAGTVMTHWLLTERSTEAGPLGAFARPNEGIADLSWVVAQQQPCCLGSSAHR